MEKSQKPSSVDIIIKQASFGTREAGDDASLFQSGSILRLTTALLAMPMT
ncbi:MAG: hypothetical protein ACFBSF_19225 [Leptolyngbyaceae cyanobacterium]